MRKLLNTLYITTPEAYLSKDSENVVVSVKQEEVFRIPIINIESIVTFGYMGASPGLMNLCAEKGVSLTFLSPIGRFIGHFQGPTRGNVLLRKAQYQNADDKEWSLQISRLLIAAKIRNYRNIVQRYIHDYDSFPEIEQISKTLNFRKNEALQADNKDTLRGIEGIAANEYFSIFPNLITQQNTDFPFNGRNRRPPKDPVNTLLSFAYTLIANDIKAALESVGLDPYVGFFHALRLGRAALALDLMEELRAYLGDRFVLSLINRKQITRADFLQQGENGILLTDKGRKVFLTAWQSRKRETIIHPYLNEKIEIGLIPHAQAMLLARYIRHDIDNYPVFLIP